MEMAFGLAAGLGFFLYGMKLMSEGLEKVAGAKMKSVLSMCTKNTFIGVLVGLIFTGIIQSSSASTVMVVSFVNSGLMTLTQSVGPILGANIGTTVTGQLVSFNFDMIAPVFILAGVIMCKFMKKPIIKKIGEICLGFGILFFGMSAMKDALSGIKDSVWVKDTISTIDNPILCILIGLVITGILQSTSAFVGILITLASTSVFGTEHLNILFYLILGSNIGACVPALIAGFGSRKEAKRSSLIHLTFNILGTVVVGLLLIPFSSQFETFILAISNGEGAHKMARAVANADTIIKVIEVIIFLPLTKVLVKLTQIIVPGEDAKTSKYELKYIDPNLAASPSVTIIEVTNEIKRMGKIAAENLELAFDSLITKNEAAIPKVLETEQEIDFLSDEITKYLVNMTQNGTIPLSYSKYIAGYFHVVSDLERIGDHAENLAEFAQSRLDNNIEFSAIGTSEVKDMFAKVIKTVHYSIDTFTDQKEEYLQEIVNLENEVDILEKQLQNNHIARMSTGECSAMSAIYSDLLSNLERVSDHATNIAFAIYDETEYGLN